MADRGEPRSDTPSDMQTTPGSPPLREHREDQRFAMSDHARPRSPIACESDPPIASESGDIADMLRDENKFLKDQIAVKDAQLAVKDRQIADQSERVRETNLLVASLHKLITPLIGQRRPDPLSAPGAPGADDIHPPQQ